jgi:hypothetical protein
MELENQLSNKVNIVMPIPNFTDSDSSICYSKKSHYEKYKTHSYTVLTSIQNCSNL